MTFVAWQVFHTLVTHFQVQSELFASPLNCFFPRFHSAFAMDRAFGSRGSFFDTPITPGSYEANPPFTEHVIIAMVERLTEALTTISDPLSIIIFVPDWHDPPAAFLPMLHATPFLRAHLLLPARRHTYVSGSQHCLARAPAPAAPTLGSSAGDAGVGHRVAPLPPGLFASVHATSVFVVQNDAGAQRWPATPAIVHAVRTACLSRTLRH
jgi:hypothetical protein